MKPKSKYLTLSILAIVSLVVITTAITHSTLSIDYSI